MHKFLIVLMISLLGASGAQAQSWDSGMKQGLEFVAETGISSPAGEPLFLCHVTRDLRIFGLNITSEITGYGLSLDRCESGPERLFSAEQMETAQSLGLVDTRLPTVPENSLSRKLQNYGIWVAIGLALIAVILRRLKSLLGLDPNGRMRKKATNRLLKTLCYVGKVDGIISSQEIALIGRTARRLSQRNIESSEIVRLADKLDMNLTTQDFINLGVGLRDSEKDRIMRGAFYVALSSGRLLPAEHEFLSNLAHGIGMPGEDFRRIMNLALNDLDTYPPK